MACAADAAAASFEAFGSGARISLYAPYRRSIALTASNIATCRIDKARALVCDASCFSIWITSAFVFQSEMRSALAGRPKTNPKAVNADKLKMLQRSMLFFPNDDVVFACAFAMRYLAAKS